MAPRAASDGQRDRVPDGPPFDASLGGRLRLRRTLLGLSQAEVATPLSVSSQQVAKFESGEARMFASQLYILSRTLGVTVDFFFEDVRSRYASDHSNARDFLGETPDQAENRHNAEKNGRMRRQVELLVEAFQKIPPGDARSNLVRTVEYLAR